MTLNFQATIENELPYLKRLSRWLTSDENKADDLMQDTLVLALRFQSSFKQGTNLRSWLTRIMKNRNTSMIRRKNLEQKTLEAEGRHFLFQSSIGSMSRRYTKYRDHLSENSFSDSVASAISELKPEFRQAVMLCDVDGLSYVDAANKVDCPLGTIMSRLHRGRKALRDRLVSRQSVEQAA